MKKAVSRVLASFFGVGFTPLAPGTAASAVAAASYALVLGDLAKPILLLIIGTLFLAGAVAAKAYSAELGKADPGRIVVDEVCGQLVALAFLPGAWPSVALGFALFRFFDIIKPWPIRKLEVLPGGWGIMADDVAAGLAAGFLGRVILIWL